VSINKDFQSFVSLVAQSISEHAGSQHRMIDIQEILKYKPNKPNHKNKLYGNIEEALGDIIASIR
jgi:hypothetical protein